MIKTSLENVLTEKQISAGLRVKEGDDFIYLLDGEKVIGSYSAFGVTQQMIRDDAETYLLTR